MMKLGIMQPYFFPYIGYFQLMNAVDEFIVYDNIQFTKKGWINRNRILLNNKDSLITLMVKKDSDYLDIVERSLAGAWAKERKKMLNRIRESYRKAPYFKEVFPLVERCILHEETNLFKFLYHSLEQTKDYLGIDTQLIISSTLAIDHSLKAGEKVLALCQAKKATTYINPIGGVELYDKKEFAQKGIALQFIKASGIEYKQHTKEFIPWLSIIDVMMFNSQAQIKEYLNSHYTLL